MNFARYQSLLLYVSNTPSTCISSASDLGGTTALNAGTPGGARTDRKYRPVGGGTTEREEEAPPPLVLDACVIIKEGEGGKVER